MALRAIFDEDLDLTLKTHPLRFTLQVILIIHPNIHCEIIAFFIKRRLISVLVCPGPFWLPGTGRKLKKTFPFYRKGTGIRNARGREI